jgi:hypothetical protein
MATINNSDLRPTGLDLFSDSEGYMDELDDNELDSIHGGFTPSPLVVYGGGYAALQSSVRCGVFVYAIPKDTLAQKI